MAKEVWTVNHAYYDGYGNIEYFSESVYEDLSDALNRIRVWNNMKRYENCDVRIKNENIRPDETTFVATKENGNTEEVCLQKVTYHPKTNTSES